MIPGGRKRYRTIVYLSEKHIKIINYIAKSKDRTTLSCLVEAIQEWIASELKNPSNSLGNLLDELKEKNSLLETYKKEVDQDPEEDDETLCALSDTTRKYHSGESGIQRGEAYGDGGMVYGKSNNTKILEQR